MIVGRFIGWVLLVLAVAAAGYEITAAIKGGGWQPIALGEIWFNIHRASLNAAQAGIQRHVAPWLWEPGIATILRAPGWVVFGVPALLLLWLCRQRSVDRKFG